MKQTLPIVCLLIVGTALVIPGRAADDSSKDNDAIKAVVEREKAGYLALDYAAMAGTWVQRPSSLKVYVYEGKERRIDGWEAISAHDKAALAAVPSGATRPQVEYSDYHITVHGDTAWVVFRANWKRGANGKTVVLTQSRLNVLTKEDGRWKFTLMAIANLTPPSELPEK